MSDARALLRAQRTARRITHPHANYSSAGTLLCILCREAIKTESLWDAHVSSSSHQKRLVEQKQRQNDQKPEDEEGPKQDGEPQKTMEVVTSHKRKHDQDEEMADAEQENGDVKRKRSRGDISVPDDSDEKDVTRTPPMLPRRSSQTPSQGVELQIPSRPATPRATPNVSSSSSTASAKIVPGPPIVATKADEKKTVDEDEWAAFEADIAAASTTYDDTTISAPAMTAEESARAKDEVEDGDPSKKQSKPDIDLVEEKEEAQRALEDEFDEMHELQEKVTKLKERRESLRQRAQSLSQADRDKMREGLGKENGIESSVAVVDEEDESSEDGEDDDDWDSFRLRR